MENSNQNQKNGKHDVPQNLEGGSQNVKNEVINQEESKKCSLTLGQKISLAKLVVDIIKLIPKDGEEVSELENDIPFLSTIVKTIKLILKNKKEDSDE